jgi:hypothetical protein
MELPSGRAASAVTATVNGERAVPAVVVPAAGAAAVVATAVVVNAFVAVLMRRFGFLSALLRSCP